MSAAELERELARKIADTAHDLADEEAVNSEICCTNTTGWGLDTFDILDVDLKHAPDEVRVKIHYQLRGDQDSEKSFHGTEVFGEANAIIDVDGEVSYTALSAERDLGNDEYEVVEGEEMYERADAPVLIVDINDKIKSYFAKHPEKLYTLDPRKFEELISEILKDLGFDTELTSITRDGGRDIYAWVKTAVTSFLMFVECKRWNPSKKVGISVVQRLHGAAKTDGAHKSMIVTTSFFTKTAQDEQKKIRREMELIDFDKLKVMLHKYH